MSKEQIEEMANTINEMDKPNAHYYGKHMEMHEAFADCFTIAEHLYNAGYRKQNEGQWTYSENKKTMKCTRCRLRMKTYDVRRYCPNCGARMKGGAE